jgi:hypothetical protein
VRVVSLAVVGLLLLYLAVRELQQQRLPLATIVALALGLLAWSLVTLGGSARESPAPRVVAPPAPRLTPLFVAVGLAIAAWLTSGNGVYTRTNLVLWLGALAAWLVTWWPGRPQLVRPSVSRADVPTLVALCLVVSIAAFFCFHSLGEVPPEPTSDHAEKLLDVRDVLRGQHPIFFPRNTGREPAQFYVTAALIKWFGRPFSWETLKLGTALVGLLAVPLIFLVGYELAGRTVGLAAAALAAVSKWPVGDDRMGLRFPYAILASALTFWFLFRYLRRGGRPDALLCGLAVAFGLHGYSPYRVLLVGVGIVFAVAAIRLRRSSAWRLPIADAGLAYATAFVASIPLAHYTVQHPDLVFMRQSSRLKDVHGFGDGLSTLVANTWKALLAFHWRGDSGWTVSVVGRPFLDPITGAALLAGAVIVVTILLTRRSLVALALVVIAPVLLLSSTLSFTFPDENPSANRMGVAVPLVFCVAALPIGVLWSATRTLARERPVLGRAPALVGGALVAALIAAAASNYRSYFHDFRVQYEATSANTSEIAAALRGTGVPRQRMFLLDYPYWLDVRNVALGLGDLDWYFTHDVAPRAPIPPLRRGGRAAYALRTVDRVSRRELARRFPGGTYVVVRSAGPGKDFALYVVPGS